MCVYIYIYIYIYMVLKEALNHYMWGYELWLDKQVILSLSVSEMTYDFIYTSPPSRFCRRTQHCSQNWDGRKKMQLLQVSNRNLLVRTFLHTLMQYVKGILYVDFHIEIKMTPVLLKTVLYGSSHDTRSALLFLYCIINKFLCI